MRVFNSGVNKAMFSFTDVSTFTSRTGKFVDYKAVIFSTVGGFPVNYEAAFGF